MGRMTMYDSRVLAIVRLGIFMNRELFAWPTDKEIELLKKVSSGEIRVVHAQRKRKLWKKRGIICRWSPYFGAWVWQPNSSVMTK
jgi:hypothetical protein